MNTVTILRRFQVPITYRCDRVCRWCDRLIGVLPWEDEDTDISMEDVRRAGELLKEHKIQVALLKVTGGEPTIHPQFVELCNELKGWVGEKGAVRISTNKAARDPRLDSSFKSRATPGKDQQVIKRHVPVLVSPTDLGLDTSYMFNCKMMTACGPMFDVFGFAYCQRAGPLGRLLGIDPYKTMMTTEVIPEICKHCPQSLTKTKSRKILEAACNGEIEHPTKTWREALKKTPLALTKFRDRKD